MKTFILIAVSLVLTACAAEPPARSFYQSQRVTGWQDENGGIHLVGVSSAEPDRPLTITGEPLHVKPLGWGGAGQVEFQRYCPACR